MRTPKLRSLLLGTTALAVGPLILRIMSFAKPAYETTYTVSSGVDLRFLVEGVPV